MGTAAPQAAPRAMGEHHAQEKSASLTKSDEVNKGSGLRGGYFLTLKGLPQKIKPANNENGAGSGQDNFARRPPMDQTDRDAAGVQGPGSDDEPDAVEQCTLALLHFRAVRVPMEKSKRTHQCGGEYDEQLVLRTHLAKHHCTQQDG